MSANENGRRLAAAHLIFNVVTGIIAIALVFKLVDLVNAISSLVGIAEDDYTLKLAVFHSVFNLIGIAVMLPLMQPLVKGLLKAIPEKLPEVDQPRYLSSASAEFPGTAIEAIRMETARIYDASRRIIVTGLGLRLDEVLSKADLDQAVISTSKIHNFDVDAVYERHIKGIYSAIIAFISETQFSRSDEPSTQLQKLREANRAMVEAVKNFAQLQNNLIYYVGSGNQPMRDFYNRIRVQIARSIREIEEVSATTDGTMDFFDLDALKLLVENDHGDFNHSMVEAVAQQIITPAMGSSLVNDSAFARSIVLNLILAAQTLYSSADESEFAASQELLLDEADVERISYKGVKEAQNNMGELH